MDFMRDYFQSQEITDIIHRHLKEQKDHIIDKNTYKERYQHNNDVFLHIRLHHATCYNVGVDYYIHCIKMLDSKMPNNIYIGTDDFNSELIKKIQTLYPKIILFKEDPVKTIQFASTCKHIVLSHGSFSAMI
jgi:hypothetical protein